MNALSMCNRPLGVIGLNESTVVVIVWYISNVSINNSYGESLGTDKPHNLEILSYAFFWRNLKTMKKKNK